MHQNLRSHHRLKMNGNCNFLFVPKWRQFWSFANNVILFWYSTVFLNVFYQMWISKRTVTSAYSLSCTFSSTLLLHRIKTCLMVIKLTAQEMRTRDKNFNFKKIVKYLKYFWFFALFIQFPADFDLLKILNFFQNFPFQIHTRIDLCQTR